MKKKKQTRKALQTTGYSNAQRRPQTQPAPARTYKARLFEMIFRQKEELLELYNALNGTSYDDPEQLEINTLENAIYMSMHNDLSFIIDSRLALYEHQSTYSPNLPLRYLMYVTELYSSITKDASLYGSAKIPIPTPNFLIFYNGTEERPDLETIRLSDLYTVQQEEYSLELKATLLNINPGHNRQLLSTCKTLRDYSEYTHRVRTYAKDMSLADAVERAITECIRDDILADFLRKYRAEAKRVSIYEYDEEKHMQIVKEEGRREGHEEGRREGLKEGLQEGIANFAELNRLLLAAGRIDDLRRASEDRDFRERLFEEYGI